MNDALTKCAIVVRNEIVFKNLPVDRAVKAVEAFIKTTYGALFTWLVRKINNSVGARSSKQEPVVRKVGVSSIDNCLTASFSSHAKARYGCIGVLDIFGFESFEKNVGLSNLQTILLRWANVRALRVWISLK